jgi:vitamin B12 transporter
MRYSLAILYLVALCQCGNLFAQSKLDKDTIRMKEIELFGNRKSEKDLLKTISVDSADINNHFSSSLTDLLSQSSVYIKNYGTSMVATPGFRGTAADHTKTYWNDIPLNSSMYGIQDLNLVPVFLLDGVDVNYSGASLVDGSGGFGGSLNLSSNTRPSPNQIELLSAVGSFGEAKEYIGVNYGPGKWWAGTKAYYCVAQNDFPYINTFRFGNPAEIEKDASMYQYGVLQSFGWQIDANDLLRANAWYQNSYRNLPQTMISNDNHEYQKDESLRADVNFRHYGKGYNWGLDGSYAREYLYYYNLISDIRSPSYNDRYELKADYKFEFKIPLNLKTGISDAEEVATIKEYNGLKMRNRDAIWADADYQLSKRLQVGLIARTESVNFIAPQLAYTGSVAFKALNEDKLVLHINGGRNFNLPNLNDLYWYPGGNPKLQPEHTWFAEAGASSDIKFKNASEIKADFTLFSNLVDDYILWTPTGSSYWQAQNLKTVWARGIESSVSFNHKWRASGLFVRAGYQFTPSTDQNKVSAYDQQLGRQLIYVPVHTAQGLVRFSYRKYELTTEYTYTGPRNTTDRQLPGFELVNVFAGRSFKWHKISFNILAKCNNLFNEAYQVIIWRPMPGRWYELSLKINIEK